MTDCSTAVTFADRAPRHAVFGAGGLLLAVATLLCLLGLALVSSPARAQTSQPRTVTFLSADGKTTLVGYLFAPQGHPKSAPAVVLMHGRTGAYSSLARGNYSSVTLSKRIRGWAELWSAQGYWALVVDSFGPRGYPAGFAAGTDASRPAAVNEVTVRPLDAYGALRYLRASPRVKSDRIALQGWSNGGSATLASMTSKSEMDEVEAGHGFRIGLALYPGCGLQGRYRMATSPMRPSASSSAPAMRRYRRWPARS